MLGSVSSVRDVRHDLAIVGVNIRQLIRGRGIITGQQSNDVVTFAQEPFAAFALAH